MLDKESKIIFYFFLFILLVSLTHPVVASTIHHHKKKKAHSSFTHSKKKHFHKKTSQKIVSKKKEILKSPPAYFAATIEGRLIHFVYTLVNTVRYSVYKLGGSRFDTSHGIYIVDCSAYVDHVLRTIYPKAYSRLAEETGSDKPTSEHYYNFFNQLPDSPSLYWNKIDDVNQLRPGDILVFRYRNTRGNETSGHVMIVMNKPILDEDGFLVRVSDSAPHGHSKDTRSVSHSGIGIGTLLLKVNPETDKPNAYAWKIGAHFKKNVAFAMARPVNSH